MHHDAPAFPVHRYGLPVDLAHEVHGPPGLLAHGQPQRVPLDRPLHRLLHGLLDAEEAVRGRQSLQRLVRPLEVVVVHELPKPLARVVEVAKQHPAPQLVLERLPEPLALAHRLRMVGPRHHVLDPVELQSLLELVLAPPREVLPPLVRQHLLGLAVLRDPRRERLEHDLDLLVWIEPVGHDVATAIVHERHEVERLATPGHVDVGDVGLPEVARLRPLELLRRADRLLAAPPANRRRGRQSLGLEHLGDAPRAHRDAREAPHEVPDLLKPERRESLLDRNDLLLDRRRQPRLSPATLPGSLRSRRRHPARERDRADAPPLREHRLREAGLLPRRNGRAPLLGCRLPQLASVILLGSSAHLPASSRLARRRRMRSKHPAEAEGVFLHTAAYYSAESCASLLNPGTKWLRPEVEGLRNPGLGRLRVLTRLEEVRHVLASARFQVRTGSSGFRASPRDLVVRRRQRKARYIIGLRPRAGLVVGLRHGHRRHGVCRTPGGETLIWYPDVCPDGTCL